MFTTNKTFDYTTELGHNHEDGRAVRTIPQSTPSLLTFQKIESNLAFLLTSFFFPSMAKDDLLDAAEVSYT